MKHGYKKRKNIYNVKMSQDKTERNLNKGNFGLNPSFKNEKTTIEKKEKSRIRNSKPLLL